MTENQNQPFNIFDSCKLHIDGICYVLTGEVAGMLQRGAILIDMREEIETMIKAFGVKRIVYLPYSEFEKKWETLPLDNPLLLADSVGLHSKEAAAFLLSKGFEQVASLAGGFAGWLSDGHPVREGKFHPLNGPCPCMIKPIDKK